MTVGRVGLSFLTARIGEFHSVIIYLSIAVVLELLFWLVPSLIVSAIAVAFLGLVLGPLFGTAMVLAAKLLPRELHVSSIGFATAIGGSGGAIFPFIVGAVAQRRGVKSLQPIILALFATITGLWLLLPRVGKKKNNWTSEWITTRLQG
jgi:fucose permease